MDLSAGLPAELNIINQDYSWSQALDYENVSFRCRTYYGIGHLAKAFPKISQTYRHRKATWWSRARPKHYIASNDESNIQHEGTKEIPEEIMSEAIQEIREPHDEELSLGASKEILATPGKTNDPPFPETSYATASLEFSYWKLVTKSSQGKPLSHEVQKDIKELNSSAFEL